MGESCVALPFFCNVKRRYENVYKDKELQSQDKFQEEG